MTHDLIMAFDAGHRCTAEPQSAEGVEASPPAFRDRWACYVFFHSSAPKCGGGEHVAAECSPHHAMAEQNTVTLDHRLSSTW